MKKPKKPFTSFERSFLAIAHYIQPIAFNNVLNGSVEYQIRSIQRWYAREFHVSIDEVEAMDIEKLLLHFFESKYEALEELDREETQAKLLETDEEREARLASEQEQSTKEMSADEELLKMIKAGGHKKLEDHSKERKAIGSLADSVERLAESVDKMAKEDEEGFTMENITEEEMDRQIAELDMSILGDPNES